MALINRIRKCLYCNQDFFPTHGKQKYCPNKDCNYQAKLERQNAEYQIGDDAKKAIQKNYELFVSILKEKEQEEFEIIELEKKGFDQFGYFGKSKDKDQIYYKVHNCYFWFSQPKKISIWRKL